MHFSTMFLRKAAARAATGAALAVLVMSGVHGRIAQAASLDPATLPRIQAATFEVVQAKPTHDPLTYEKPLPLDLLPFQERTDKYYSIGTAFAIGKNRYVTAGHVLRAGINSLWGAPQLRDADGHVYAIGKIEKFSLGKDFVVFSLATPPAKDVALAINDKPMLNTVVYAVGNALGTGVVIRDGLYTSNTPEEQNGSWKWMRFSAAASPGNSGGPLLDKNGKLIGVVLMKSQNENLNYALPISEVLNAPEGQAVMDTRVRYQFDVFDVSQNSLFQARFALPASFADFSKDFLEAFDANSDHQLKALLAKESANLFPRGAGSSRLLHAPAWLDTFPYLIVRDDTGNWDLSGKKSDTIALEANGAITPGIAGNSYLFHLRRPDDLPASRLYSEPKLLMDQLAKTGMFMRQVGSEQIKITSLGAPVSASTHVDTWQRRWQVGEWLLPYANSRVVMYSLPVPDGYVMMMRFAPPGHEHDSLLDLAALTDFISVDYDGTLAEWKDYLKYAALLPAALHDITLDFDYGKRFSYSSRRIAFSFTPELQKITPDSLLTLGFSFFSDHGKVVWDVSDISVWKDRASSDEDRVHIQRFVKPSDDLDDSTKATWRQVAERQHPYDGVARSESDMMKIDANASPPTAGAMPDFLYTAFYGVEGNRSQAEMKAKLDLLTGKLRVIEH
jgi:serine protease Do